MVGFWSTPWRGTTSSRPTASTTMVTMEDTQVEIRAMASPSVVFCSTLATFWASVAQGTFRFIRFPVAKVR